MIKFQAIIYKIGINPVIDPPGDVLDSIFLQAGRSKGPIPVCGLLDGAEFIQTLVKYGGAWRLYINGPMLKAAGCNVGDTVTVEIGFDPRKRDVPMPDRLREMLDTNKIASDAFNALTPSRKKEVLRYLGSLRSDEALERNIEKVIRTLVGESDAPPIFMSRK